MTLRITPSPACGEGWGGGSLRRPRLGKLQFAQLLYVGTAGAEDVADIPRFAGMRNGPILGRTTLTEIGP